MFIRSYFFHFELIYNLYVFVKVQQKQWEPVYIENAITELQRTKLW